MDLRVLFHAEGDHDVDRFARQPVAIRTPTDFQVETGNRERDRERERVGQ